MIDIDYSFLRLRDNLQDAINLSESPSIEFEYVGQIQLLPNETYLQITNSPTSINLSSWEAHLVDACGVEVLDITSNMFITNFIDSNGRSQIVWEFINKFEYWTKPLSIRFTETSNGLTWFTNLFVSTAYESELTVRFDYKNNKYHYGTEYERANFYQSIRLQAYFDNPVEDISVEAYVQITTDREVPYRATYVDKEQYLLHDVDGFTKKRVNRLLRSNEIYVTNNGSSYRVTNTAPLESEKRELDSNIQTLEMVLNPFYEDTFDFDFQIFEGFLLTSMYVEDNGSYTPATVDADLTMTFNLGMTLNTGGISIWNSLLGTLIVAYTESDMSVLGQTLTIPNVFGTGNDVTTNNLYYITVTDGLVSSTGTQIDNEQIPTFTWNFQFIDGMFEVTEFDNTEFLTN